VRALGQLVNRQRGQLFSGPNLAGSASGFHDDCPVEFTNSADPKELHLMW
jgi:hypothetical protein